MSLMNRTTSLVRNVFHKANVESDLDAEVRNYVEMASEDKIRNGRSREQARRETLLELEGIEQVKEKVRDVQTGALLEQTLQDLRYACRTLARSKCFAIAAALSLALGIGGNTAMFSVVDAVLIRPLPYMAPDRLMKVTGYYPRGAVAALQAASRTMDVAGFTTDSEFNLTGQGEAVRLAGSRVSANLFSLLGVRAELGRAFERGEDEPGPDRIILLSHTLWQKKFGGNPDVLGRVVNVEGVDRQIVGVMPPGFAFPSTSVQLWIPLHMAPSPWEEHWGAGFMPAVARLRPGATIAQAQSELRSLIPQVIKLFPYPMAHSWNADAAVVPLQRDMTGDIREKLLVLLCGVALVLLIACSNVAGLLVSRSLARRKEIAVRLSLGASRGRIVRQLLTESVALGLVGGAIGVALAAAGLNTLKMILPADTPQLAQASLDWRVLAFAGALAVLSGIGFGLAPALHASGLDLAPAMRSTGQRNTGVSGVRLRGLLVAAEVALSVMLVTGAGLLIMSLWRLSNVSPGFRPEHVLSMRISLSESRCQERAACIAFYDEVVRRAREISGVAEAAVVNGLPLSGEMPEFPAELENRPNTPGNELAPMLWAGAVTPGYFRLMQIPLLMGRGFTEADGAQSARVVIVTRATARRYWPGQDPIGKHIRVVFEDQAREVVGVAADVKQYDLAGHAPGDIRGAVYMPYAQSVGNNRKLPASMTLVLKAGRDSSRIAGDVRALVASMSADVPVSEPHTMDGLVYASTSQPRSMMWLFASFGGLALLLAAIGTYGVISYSTAQRTYEIGMRMALGADPGMVFRMVIEKSLVLVAAGLAAGMVGAAMLSRALTTFLYGVTATDPLTFAAVAILMMAVAVIAGYFPARRAAKLNPSVLLRTD